MKSIITLLTLVFISLSVYSQQSNCRNAMPEGIFRQRYKAIMNQKTENMKLDLANNLAVNNCMNVEQVKAIADLFVDDFARLDFARNAYINTVDKDNFYFVYDAFAYISTVFMLHDYINGFDRRPYDPLPPSQPALNLNFAALDYPDYRNYRGPSNCAMPISEDDFIRLARQYAFGDNEQNKNILFTQLVQNNCMSAAQVIKLASLLENENNRLSLFRSSIPSVYDLTNLSFGSQLFGHIPNRNAFSEMIRNLGSAPPPPMVCEVTPAQFSDMISSIKKESFNSTKMTLTKNILKSNPCFNTRQIKDILAEFSFDSNKLEIAKFAWDYTVDKANYYRVADAFSYSSSKDELMKYIESRQ